MRSMHSRVAKTAILLGGRFPNLSVRSFVTSRQPSPTADPHLFKMVYEIDTKMAVAGHFKSRLLNADDRSPSGTAVNDNIASAATPGVPRAVYVARREALCDRMPQPSIAVFLAKDMMQRSRDILHRYVPDTNLWYLSGCEVPGAVLVVVRDDADENLTSSVLFVPTKDPKEEVMEGYCESSEEYSKQLGIHVVEFEELTVVTEFLAKMVEKLRRGDDELMRSEDTKKGAKRTQYAMPTVFFDAPEWMRSHEQLLTERKKTANADNEGSHQGEDELCTVVTHASHAIVQTLYEFGTKDRPEDLGCGYLLPSATERRLFPEKPPLKFRALSAPSGSAGQKAANGPTSHCRRARIIKSTGSVMGDVRAVKCPTTIRNFIRAADITAVAFAQAMLMTSSRVDRTETDVSNRMENEMKTLGARGFAYEPVIAGGTRSLALHYIRNDAPLHRDELIRVDAGADFFGHPIDCSRTWPVSGKWNAGQLELYEAVQRIQGALIEMCQEGTCVDDIARTAQELTRNALLDLGVMGREAGTPNSAAAVVDLLFPHSFGHFFGHDIHERIPRSSKLVAGSMHTVEPGIYIPQAPSNEREAAAIKKRYGDLLDIERIPPELRGLGICIEDVVCVLPSNANDRTAFVSSVFDADSSCFGGRRAVRYMRKGALLITGALPSGSAEIEELCSSGQLLSLSIHCPAEAYR